MQDSYATMMAGQQRTDPLTFKTDPGMSFKSYSRAGISQPTASAASYYHGLNYGTPSFSASENFTSSMAIPTSVSHEYSPMPAHMQNPHTIHHTDLSRGLNSGSVTHATTSHLPIHQNVTSPQPTSPLGMASSPPMPSSSRVDSVSPEHDRSGHISSSSPGDNSMSKDLSDNSSEKSSDIKDEDSQGIPPKKRALSSDHEQQRDGSYWDKRKKNNESAKRSREARRMKEEQIALRVVYLEQENLQLRTEVSLLKSEIEKLRCMLYNSWIYMWSWITKPVFFVNNL